ncbi:MAG TPA: hypothetical protein VM597_17705 [Gemmataceae bacterium]|nr:hypothetical protein [Gemmataceae bacterium]
MPPRHRQHQANRTPLADRSWDEFGVLETVLQTTVAPCALRRIIPNPLKALHVTSLTGDR